LHHPVQLSLVVPCYNEGANVALLIERIDTRIDTASGIEVIRVDNGSTDGSVASHADRIAGHPVIRLVNVAVNRGYGHGILAGLRAGRGAFLGWTHADLQTDPADAVTALGVVKGAARPAQTFVKGKRVGRPLADRIFTAGMTAFETLLLGTVLQDINAQPNVFPRWFYEAIADGAPDDFSLDLYFLYEARRRGLAVARFPVGFGRRTYGMSHWNTGWQSRVRFIRRTIDYSLKLRRRVASASGRVNS
jgi:glycosyltransferase involved in cell wall biosynthesis